MPPIRRTRRARAPARGSVASWPSGEAFWRRAPGVAVLVSASLDRAEVPLAVRVEGKVEADPDADFALDWRALVAVVLVP
jgi:hypothetical protein